MTSQDRNRPFSQFVEFVVDARHQSGLVSALTDRTERFTRTYPGFISASVQVSEDGLRVLSQVLWDSREDCERAVENAEATEQDFWSLIRQHRATALTFNAYQMMSQTVGRR